MTGLLRALGHLLLAALLTVVTQVGGVVYLLSVPLARFAGRRTSHRWLRRLTPLLTFVVLYAGASALLVPAVAGHYGRVPLPPGGRGGLAPAHWGFVAANRHYVRPALRELLLDAAATLRADDPELRVRYLDAGFPFCDGFPLLPHLSHDDGCKVDLAFYWIDTAGAPPRCLPQAFGNGYSAGPRDGEPDQPAACAARGYWQYGLMAEWTTPDPTVKLDEVRTRALILALSRDRRVGKLLLEPHLKARLRLGHRDNIRFHGCRAVPDMSCWT